MKLIQKLLAAAVLTIPLALFGACHREPPKTEEYFKKHPEEIRTEAKRCVDLLKQNKSIEKEQTCMTLAQLAGEACHHQQMMMGGVGFTDMDCSDPKQVLVLTAQGF